MLLFHLQGKGGNADPRYGGAAPNDGMMDSSTNGNAAAAAAAAAALSASFNNNSFGLGPSLLADKDGKDGAKLDVEVAENLVGAILGPGGKVRSRIIWERTPVKELKNRLQMCRGPGMEWKDVRY